MGDLIKLVQVHPYITSAITTWFTNVFITSAVSSLPAPTAQSKPFYIWFFKFSNKIIGNIPRSRNTAVESSPNWTPALEKALKNGATNGIVLTSQN